MWSEPSAPARPSFVEAIDRVAGDEGRAAAAQQADHERKVLHIWQTASFTRTERVAMHTSLAKHPERWSAKELEIVHMTLFEQLSRGDWDDADTSLDVLDVMSAVQRETVVHARSPRKMTLLHAAVSAGGGPIQQVTSPSSSTRRAATSPSGSSPGPQQRYQAYLKHRLLSAVCRLAALGCRQLDAEDSGGKTPLDLCLCPALRTAIREAVDSASHSADLTDTLQLSPSSRDLLSPCGGSSRALLRTPSVLLRPSSAFLRASSGARHSASERPPEVNHRESSLLTFYWSETT